MEKEECPRLSSLTVPLQPAREGPRVHVVAGTGGAGLELSSEAGSRRRIGLPGGGGFPLWWGLSLGWPVSVDGRADDGQISSSNSNSSSDPGEPDGRSRKHHTPHLRAAEPDQVRICNANFQSNYCYASRNSQIGESERNQW